MLGGCLLHQQSKDEPCHVTLDQFHMGMDRYEKTNRCFLKKAFNHCNKEPLWKSITQWAWKFWFWIPIEYYPYIALQWVVEFVFILFTSLFFYHRLIGGTCLKGNILLIFWLWNQEIRMIKWEFKCDICVCESKCMWIYMKGVWGRGCICVHEWISEKARQSVCDVMIGFACEWV
jgi:hypothetical protein